MPVPRISGAPLRTLARFARTGPGAASAYRSLRADLRTTELASLPEGLRGGMLFSLTPQAGRPPRTGEASFDPPPRAGWAPSSADFARAYASKRTTPIEVTTRCFAAARDLAGRKPVMGPMIALAEDEALRAAKESTERHARGAPLGPLDGVPFVVKEQSAVRGLPRQNGTRFLPETPCEADAAFVEALRAAGAIVLGTTLMTELGMSPLGQNRLRNMPRNPYDAGHLAGGSSTGSGVAVGTGLVPIGIGVDGGGSIRTPAAWNGVFGIKPTWGRVSRRGTLAEGSMSHVGPIANSVLDLARALDLMSDPDPADHETAAAPRMARGAFEAALRRGVRGLRIGVEEREWSDATSDVERAGREALRALEREGAVLVPIRLELARFVVGIGVLSIAPEARTFYRRATDRHIEKMGHDLQVSFSALGCVTALDFLDTQRLRTGLREEITHTFRDLDLIALPTTATPPPPVTDAEMASGFLDSRALERTLRFAFLANLTGLPAGTAPAGLTAGGLPLGFQLVGDAYDDATVLAALGHLERIGFSKPARPRVAVDILH